MGIELTRRDAIRSAAGLAALGAVGTLAGSPASAAEAPAYEHAKTPADVSGLEQLSCDVLVIGGGGAGICASLAASQAGAKVIICEKLGMLGGATILSGGKIPAVGTKQ